MNGISDLPSDEVRSVKGGYFIRALQRTGTEERLAVQIELLIVEGHSAFHLACHDACRIRRAYGSGQDEDLVSDADSAVRPSVS